MTNVATTDAVVDVVLAAFNGERYVAAQIESILAQTLRSFRLLIRDDGSVDGTWAILEKYAARDTRITLLQDRTHVGHVASFESLLQAVRAPFFALCDQDDVWHSDRLRASVDALNVSGRALAYSDLELVDRSGRPLGLSMWQQGRVAPLSGICTAALLIRNSVTGCSVSGRSDILRTALPFPENIPVHDWWLALVASELGGLVAISRRLVRYRQHGENVLGASGWGTTAVRARMRRFQMNLAEYAGHRRERRIALARGLIDRQLASWQIQFLCGYWRQPAWLRLLGAPLFGLILLALPQLRVRAAVSEFLGTCLPLDFALRLSSRGIRPTTT